MWDKIVRHSQTFSSAVLTALDDEGYPLSVRCHPQPDTSAEALLLQMPPGVPVQAGRGCLLFHRHDERLWNLKSFVVQGELAAHGEGYLFRPDRFIPGMGIEGVRSYVAFVAGGRRQAKRYLEKRGLPRPAIDWQELGALIRPKPGR